MTTNSSNNSENIAVSQDNAGIVYVLTNPAMPGLVKIGKTSQNEVSARISQLYTTGVPLPFDCEYAVKVADMTQTEEALHTAFRSSRLNPNREFFEIQVDQVTAILNLLMIEDVTPGVDTEAKEDINDADKTASEKFKSRRPDLDFGDLGIPVGAVLEFARNKEEMATVADTNTRTKTRVNYQGNEYPISGLTATLLGWQSSYVPNSGRYWNYEGRNLQEIYNDFHGF